LVTNLSGPIERLRGLRVAKPRVLHLPKTRKHFGASPDTLGIIPPNYFGEL